MKPIIWHLLRVDLLMDGQLLQVLHEILEEHALPVVRKETALCVCVSEVRLMESATQICGFAAFVSFFSLKQNTRGNYV